MKTLTNLLLLYICAASNLHAEQSSKIEISSSSKGVSLYIDGEPINPMKGTVVTNDGARIEHSHDDGIVLTANRPLTARIYQSLNKSYMEMNFGEQIELVVDEVSGEAYCRDLASFYHFDDNPYISAEIKEQIRPYLVRKNYPARAFLDRACMDSRFTFNSTAFSNAGFVDYIPQKPYLLIGYNVNFPNFVVKAYTDRCEGNDQRLATRITTSQAILRLIDEQKMRYITVPEKWAYPLAEDPQPPAECIRRKGFIVVQNRLSLSSPKVSAEKFAKKGTWNKRWIWELFTLFTHFTIDNINFENMVFTEGGKKLAFIDLEIVTEPSRETRERIRGLLPEKWHAYWDKLEDDYQSGDGNSVECEEEPDGHP